MSHGCETWVRQSSSLFEQSSLVHVWSDVDIEPGSQWDATLRQKMARCDIAILLVSMPFLQSEYVRTVELPFLLERAHASRAASVVDICVAESVAEHGTARYSGGFASKGVAGGNEPRGYPSRARDSSARIEQYVRASDGPANLRLQPTADLPSIK